MTLSLDFSSNVFFMKWMKTYWGKIYRHFFKLSLTIRKKTCEQISPCFLEWTASSGLTLLSDGLKLRQSRSDAALNLSLPPRFFRPRNQKTGLTQSFGWKIALLDIVLEMARRAKDCSSRCIACENCSFVIWNLEFANVSFFPISGMQFSQILGRGRFPGLRERNGARVIF